LEVQISRQPIGKNFPHGMMDARITNLQPHARGQRLPRYERQAKKGRRDEDPGWEADNKIRQNLKKTDIGNEGKTKCLTHQTGVLFCCISPQIYVKIRLSSR